MPIDFRSCLNALSDVIINRPPPLRHFDQIYMKLPDMLLQAELIGRWFNGKRVLFVGDALVLDEIKPGDLEITLAEFEVALGPSTGKAAESYLQGHIDKGCFTKSARSRAEAAQKRVVRKIGYTAQLKEPFAVLLRG